MIADPVALLPTLFVVVPGLSVMTFNPDFQKDLFKSAGASFRRCRASVSIWVQSVYFLCSPWLDLRFLSTRQSRPETFFQ